MDPITLSILAGSAVKYASDLKKSEKLKEQADKKNIKACKTVADAEMAKKRAEQTMEQEVLKLLNRKKGILVTTMKKFVDLYSRIIKINFTKEDGIPELEGSIMPLIQQEKYNLIINEVGNIKLPATLDGNVIKGFLIGGIIGAATASMVNDSQYKLDMARIHAKQAELKAEHIRIIALSYDGIIERVKRITDTLTNCNLLFNKTIAASVDIIDKNGKNKSLYSDNEIKIIGTCINLANAICRMIDAPIIDENGEVTEMSRNAIEKSISIVNETQMCLKNNI